MIASNWLAYSLTNFVTGPIITTHTLQANTGHTVFNSVGNRFAKSFEIGISSKLSKPIYENIHNQTKIDSTIKYLAIFEALQSAEYIGSSIGASKLIPTQLLPKSYLARLKSNIEFDAADQHADSINQSLFQLIDSYWDAPCVSMQGSAPLTETPLTHLRTPSNEVSSNHLTSASYIKDYIIFSLFYLLKTSTTSINHPLIPSLPYISLLADAGMVISSDKFAQSIADYLLEKREMALDSFFTANPYLEEIQKNSEILIKNIHASLPQTIQQSLHLASPSDNFYAQHSSTYFTKELLTSMAVAIPANAIGIHLLPKIFNPNGLAFSIIMETSTNVIIHLATRAGRPFSDFLSEKFLSAIEGLQYIISSAISSAPALHSGENQPPTGLNDILVDHICAAVDSSVLEESRCFPHALNAPEPTEPGLPLTHAMHAQEWRDPIAMLIGVIEPSDPSTAA